MINIKEDKTERKLEVNKIKSILKRHSIKMPVLEIGNVLTQYGIKHNLIIIDKFEKGKNIKSIDIMKYKPKNKFKLAISISTIEHIGRGRDKPHDITKPIKAINHIIENCLKKGGKLIITIPIGYTKYLDQALKNKLIKINKRRYYKKIKNKWTRINEKTAWKNKYYKIFKRANAILIGEIKTNQNSKQKKQK